MKKLTIHKVRKLFLNHLTSCGYKQNTIYIHEEKMKTFFEYIALEGIGDMRDVNVKVLHRFLTWLNEKVSGRTGKLLAARTKKGIFTTVKLLFRCLYLKELILVNPLQNIVYRPVGEQKQREILTEDEMNRFLDGIDERKLFGIRDKAIFELMYSSGLRAGDITNLDAGNVDFETRMVLLKEGKFSKDRVVPVSKVAAAFLKIYLKERRRETEILFTSPCGLRISPGAVNIRCKKWMKESGVYRKGVSSHSIRHSTAVHLLSHGVDLRYVQELLGHESIETTVTYTHDLHENIRRVYKSYHPRENLYFKEVDEVYLDRLNRLKEKLSRQKRITRRERKIKKRFYAKNRDKLLKKTRKEYRQKKKQGKKELTEE
jgi:integrase/recombinase XerD